MTQWFQIQRPDDGFKHSLKGRLPRVVMTWTHPLSTLWVLPTIGQRHNYRGALEFDDNTFIAVQGAGGCSHLQAWRVMRCVGEWKVYLILNEFLPQSTAFHTIATMSNGFEIMVQGMIMVMNIHVAYHSLWCRRKSLHIKTEIAKIRELHGKHTSFILDS